MQKALYWNQGSFKAEIQILQPIPHATSRTGHQYFRPGCRIRVSLLCTQLNADFKNINMLLNSFMLTKSVNITD